MPKPPALSREDEVLLRLLKTPPKPHAPLKAKTYKNQEVRRKTEKSKPPK